MLDRILLALVAALFGAAVYIVTRDGRSDVELPEPAGDGDTACGDEPGDRP
jgi:hypothetical protein